MNELNFAITNAETKIKELEGEGKFLQADEQRDISKWLKELRDIKQGFITVDGVEVKEGDTVWVQGSTAIEDTTVQTLKPVTTYSLFGKIPVDESFSTKEAAEKFRYGDNK